MNSTMPCGLDDPRIRFELEEEDTDPRSLLERRLSWICDSWADAMEIDTSEAWADVRAEIYGATQALNYCTGRFEDSNALDTMRSVCMEHSIRCIKEGRYVK